MADLATLTDCVLRSKITKSGKVHERMDLNEVNALSAEVDRRMTLETDMQEAHRWDRYKELLVQIQMHKEAQKSHHSINESWSEDEMAELEEGRISDHASDRKRNEGNSDQENHKPRREKSESQKSNSSGKVAFTNRGDEILKGKKRNKNKEGIARSEKKKKRMRKQRAETSSEDSSDEESSQRKGSTTSSESESRSSDKSELESDSESETESSSSEEERYKRRRHKKSKNYRTNFSFVNTIEPFDGDFAKWNIFRSIVNKLVIKPKDIRKAMKVNIVSKLLKGEAQDIWNTAVSRKFMAEKGMKALEAHYENPTQINAYIHGIIAKMPKVSHDSDVKSLAELSHQVKRFKALMDQLGHKFDALAGVLSYQVADKLWEREARKLTVGFTGLDYLVDHIDKLYQGARTLAVYRKPWGQHEYRASFPSMGTNRTSNTGVPTGNRYGQRVASINLRKRCNFCGANEHWTSDCEAVGLEDKRRIIQEKNMCRRCCSLGHEASVCRARFVKCKTCERIDHASAIHGLQSNAQAMTIEEAEARKERARTEAEICHVGTEDRKCFWTKVRYGATTINLLIDTGAAITLVNARCIPQYSRKPIDSMIIQGFGKSMVSTIREVANIEIDSPEGVICLEAYVNRDMSENTIIIGRDQLQNVLKEGSRIMKTVWGSFDFSTQRWLDENASINTCDRTSVVWHEREDEEKVDESAVAMIVRKLATGRYQANFPFLSNSRPRENYAQAERKIIALVDRLKRSDRLEDYQMQIQELIQLGHAVPIISTRGHFIGHRAVERPDAVTSKFRVVLTPLELNELLWKGEVKGMDVLSHLLRLRSCRFALTADLQKAFLQIEIAPEDRQYVQFLWMERGNISKYQMKVLPFGIVSAPAILARVLELVVKEMPETTRSILFDSIYMDDILIGHESASTLEVAIRQASEHFAKSGFNLHKIRSNAKLSWELDDQQAECKVLGLRWNPEIDELRVPLPSFHAPSTRRDLLSCIGRIFDPYGMYDPCKLELRGIYARTLKLKWDERMPAELIQATADQIKTFPQELAIALPRKLPTSGTLWCFSDASQKAYGYAIYYEAQFVFGRAKWVSTNRSIVDRELQALFELCKAIPKILGSLRGVVDIKILSDSQPNLDRLKKSPNEHPIVEARRLFNILKIASSIDASFYHVPGVRNPADCFSRPQTLKESRKWLSWNLNSVKMNLASKIMIKTVCQVEPISKDSAFQEWFSRRTLVSQMAWVNKLKNWLRKANKQPEMGRVSVFENIAFVHQSDEQVAPPGCITVQGVKFYPARNVELRKIWIPKKSKLAHQLLWTAHIKSKHRGVDMSIAMLPTEVQVHDGNRQMRRIIASCLRCRMSRGRGIMQPLGPLHEQQKGPRQAFEDLSMDCFGPLKLANGRKFWGLASVCRSSKAVRINVLEDLSGEALFAVLLSQWSQTGFPRRVHSDHGSNFIAVRNRIRIAPSLDTCNLIWTLSTPTAPWMNGEAEKMVHTVKSTLEQFVKSTKSHLEAQRRFVTVERIVNSRPVLQMDGVAISAFEIAFGRKLVLEASHSTVPDPAALLKRRKQREEEICLLWKSQYLSKVAKYCPEKGSPVNLGDMFLVPDKMKRRTQWSTARVKELKTGSDNLCRSVKLEFPNGEILWRPTQTLVPLNPAPAEG